MRVIFWDRCRVVHIPFVCMVELKFPAHFLVDHLADPVVPRIIIIIIIIIITLRLWEFFSPALADRFSLEFEWQ